MRQEGTGQKGVSKMFDWIEETIALAIKLFHFLLAIAMALIMISITLFSMAYLLFMVILK